MHLSNHRAQSLFFHMYTILISLSLSKLTDNNNKKKGKRQSKDTCFLLLLGTAQRGNTAIC